MKKNVMMRIASVLMIAVLLTTCVISGTFAKYTSSATGEDEATIARWAFSVGGTDITPTATTTFNFDLFSSILDEDGATEENVKSDLIAPGTSGTIELSLTNNSEVKAQYTIAFELTNPSNIPILFSIDEGQNWIDLATLNTKFNASQVTNIISWSTTKDFTISWKWAYETNDGDTIDTTAGIGKLDGEGNYDSAYKVILTANLTATQVN